jgi:predicted nuclease of predicted toxin-antitoxin system
MKLLFDQNISFRVIKKLNKYFSDSKHVSECDLQDSDDIEIWEYAKSNSYTIVTFDADFYDISLINGHPPKIIWLITGNLSTTEITELLISKGTTIDRFLNDDDYKKLSCLEII